MSEQPRLLVVDDDARIVAALSRALRYAGYEVETAADGAEALRRSAAEGIDLVILDLGLPGVDGLDVCRRIRADSDLPVLMLTARDAVPDRVRGFDAGADDYLVKPFANEELLSRVEALLRRSGRRRRRLTFGDIAVDTVQHEVRRGDRLIDLTPREYALLAHLLRHPRQVLSRDQLLDAVWGVGSATSANLVDVYVGYLRDKLEASGEPRVVHTVRGVGFVLRET